MLQQESPIFQEDWRDIRTRRHSWMDEYRAGVDAAIDGVRQLGEGYLLKHAREIDGVDLSETELWVPPAEIKNSHKKLDPKIRKLIEESKSHIQRFHSELIPRNVTSDVEAGFIWSSQIQAVQSVGIYVPGTRTNYFMSLLEAAIPARLMGVERIVVATPPRKKKELPASLLYAAKILEIDEILLSGGPPALAALAFGLKDHAPVHLLVGGSGRRTAVAKARLAGYVGVDGFTSTPESAYVLDDSAQVDWVVSDILMRAERESEAEFFVFHTDERWVPKMLDTFASGLQLIKESTSRAAVEESLEKNLFFIKVRNVEASMQLVNELCPSYVSLHVKDPARYRDRLKNCSVLVLTPELPLLSLEIMAGPSSLVPGGGASLYASIMTAETFARRQSVVGAEREAVRHIRGRLLAVAEEEGFHTHQWAYKTRGEL